MLVSASFRAVEDCECSFHTEPSSFKAIFGCFLVLQVLGWVLVSQSPYPCLSTARCSSGFPLMLTMLHSLPKPGFEQGLADGCTSRKERLSCEHLRESRKLPQEELLAQGGELTLQTMDCYVEAHTILAGGSPNPVALTRR
eukprot:2901676-Amphidinium_carterae.1